MPHQRQDSCAAEAAATSSTTLTAVTNNEEAYVEKQVGQARQQPVDDNDHPEMLLQQQQQQQVAVSRPEFTIAERNRLLALSQQPQRVDIMAGRISELEGALAASERRIKSLVYSTAPTAASKAAAASKAGKPDDVAAMRRRCAERVRQLEDVLVQAEKRASWLQGELKLVSACAGEHIRELEGELLAAKVERGSRDSDCGSSGDASTGSSSGGGGGGLSSSGRDVDKVS